MEPQQTPSISHKYDLQLEEFSKANKAYQWLMPSAGLVLGVAAACLVAYPFTKDCSYACSDNRLYMFIVACLLVIAAIICFMSHRNIVLSPAVFKRERIFLRDLTIALELAMNLPEKYERKKEIRDKDGNLQKSETEEQYLRARQIEKIIQTLTNRYPN